MMHNGSSASEQAHRAQKSKGNSPKGTSMPKKMAHKSDQGMGMQDGPREQVNGYNMPGDGRGNY